MAAVLGGLACDRVQPLPAASSSQAPVVAWVDGRPIHADAVAATLRRRGRGDARAALDELVAFELLARAAAAAGAAVDDGLGEDPVHGGGESDGDGEGEGEGDGAAEARAAASFRGRDAVKAMMVQRLIEREIEPQLGPAAITEAEVRALYERGRKRFVHGRLVRIAVLAVFTGARMKPDRRARAEATARALKTVVDEAAGSPTSPNGPASPQASAARDASELERIAAAPEWQGRGVTVTTTWQAEDEPFPPVVGKAALALRRPGETTGVLGDETGYYIVRYLAEKPPENVGFDEAAPALRAEMLEPWRRQKFLQLARALAGPHEIEVHAESLPLLGGAPAAP